MIVYYFIVNVTGNIVSDRHWLFMDQELMLYCYSSSCSSKDLSFQIGLG